MEILCMDVSYLTLEDLAELEPAETVTDITLRWRWPEVLPLKEVLLVVKGWQHLSRLTFTGFVETEISVPSFEVLDFCDFIMEMKHLSHLHIVLDYDDDGQLETLFDKVNELILPLRPNFKFDISRIYV